MPSGFFVPADGQEKAMGGKILNSIGVKGSEVYLYGEVGLGPDEISSGRFLEAIGIAERSGAGEVTLHVNSAGGDIFEAVAIVAAIQRSPARITAIVDGLAASAASLIIMGAKRIIMTPGSMMMIHEPFTFASGTAADFIGKAKALEEASEGIVDLYAKRTGNSPAEIRKWMEAETWMNAKTALERGFCDAIEGQDEPEAPAVANAITTAVLGRFRHAPSRAFCLLGRTQTAATGGKEHEMKTILAALGLPEDANEEQAVERITALRSLETDALKITNSATGADALKIVGKLQADAAQVQALSDEKVKLTARVAELEAAQVKAEVTSIIDGLKGAGKLVPAQEQWARELGEKDIAQLKAFAASAPVILAKEVSEPAPAVGGLKKPFAEMSVDEKAALYESNRELYEKLKTNG